MTGPVRLEHVGTALVITIARPEVRNAINVAVAEGIHKAVELLDADDRLQVGVLTGAGGYFSSGMDLQSFATDGRDPVVGSRGLAGIQYEGPAKPLIAAVEGFALAGGLELALCCDLIVAAEDAEFGIPEVKRGLIAAGGGLLRLSHRLPTAAAMEMALTGDSMGARRAYDFGLVNRLSSNGQALADALRLADAIAANAPMAVRAGKSLIRSFVGLTEAEAWALQEPVTSRVVGSDDAKEGSRAFLERREPRWAGR